VGDIHSYESINQKPRGNPNPTRKREFARETFSAHDSERKKKKLSRDSLSTGRVYWQDLGSNFLSNWDRDDIPSKRRKA